MREPQQRSCVRDQRMMDDAAFLRDLDTLEPGGKPLLDVLLEETLLANAAVVALERDRAVAHVRQQGRRDRFVVRGEVALRNSVIRKQHLVRMRDRDRL